MTSETNTPSEDDTAPNKTPKTSEASPSKPENPSRSEAPPVAGNATTRAADDRAIAPPPAAAPTQASHPHVPAAPVAATRGSSAGLWLAVLDLLAILGLAGGAYLALQNLENQRFSVQQRMDTLIQTVNKLDVAKQGREQWFTETEERSRATQRSLVDLQRNQLAMSAHQEQTDKSLGQLSVQVQGGQHAWQRAEIEHLLLVANTRLQLQRDVDGAKIALRLSNERLASLSNPAYFPVREQISRELAQLDAVPQIDLQALALQLGSLTDQVESLAVRVAKVGNYDTALKLTGGTPDLAWYRRLWVSVQETVSSLVSVRRDEVRREPLLPPDQAVYLQQNLRLQLESARLAALKLDPANYAAALRQAETWLQRYFDTQQAPTAAALQSIRRLQSMQLKPALPDISGSLTALRATETGT